MSGNLRPPERALHRLSHRQALYDKTPHPFNRFMLERAKRQVQATQPCSGRPEHGWVRCQACGATVDAFNHDCPRG